MKKLSFAAGVVAIALAVSTIFPVAGVFANTATYDGTNNRVTLRRNVTGVTNPVTNTYTYTISPKSNYTQPGTATTVPSSATIAFNGVTPTSGTATQTAVIDLASVDFSKVGDYIYTVTETASSNSTNYPVDSTNSYDIQISVRYQVDANNVPNNNVYLATVSIKNNTNSSKVTEAVWTSGTTYTYIEATATTTGNMAEKEECFEYTIDIPAENGVAGSFVIDIVPATGTSACTGSASSVTAGTPATIKLKHGDTVHVGYNGGAYQLPAGAKYTITKTNSGDEYIEKFDSTNGSTTTKTAVAVSNTSCDENNEDGEGCFSKNNVTNIENNKQASPLTGVITNFWFYLMLLIIGAFGLFIFLRKKQDNEEQQA